MRLPEEVLLEIFEHVAAFYDNKPNARKLGCSSSPTWDHQFPNDSEGPAWSIMAVRLTCRRFCALSSHLLIRSLQIDMSDSSLELLNNISTHPVFSKSVRALRVSIHEHLPPSDDNDLDSDARWYWWIHYHLTELNLCVPISPGVAGCFPRTSDHKLKHCIVDKSQGAHVTQASAITQVADVVFIMLDTWDSLDLRWCSLDIPDQDLRLFLQDLKERIHERHQQQRKWLKKLTELGTTIAAALQRMPRASVFEVGDYNPDMFEVGDYDPKFFAGGGYKPDMFEVGDYSADRFLTGSGPLVQRFRRYREVLARPIQPQEADWKMVFRTVVAPVLLRPLSGLERREKDTLDEGSMEPMANPVEGGYANVLPLLDVATYLPYRVAQSNMTLTHLSMRIDIGDLDVRINTAWDSSLMRPLDHWDDLFHWESLALRHIKSFSFVCDPGLWNESVFDLGDPRSIYSLYLSAPNLEEIRLSAKTLGEPVYDKIMGGDCPYPVSFLPFDIGYDSIEFGSWETLRVLSLKGSRVVFSVFKESIALFKRHGSLRVLELVRLLLIFGTGVDEGTWADALDFLRNTRPCNGPISICHPAGEFDDYEYHTGYTYAFQHSVPGEDGTPGVRSPAEVYVMGGTVGNPLRPSTFHSGFAEPAGATQ